MASKDYPIQRAAFFTFFPVSAVVAVIYLVGGFMTGTLVIGLFLIGSLLDLLAAVAAGRGTWAVDASHFAERNGLFVIIALGESVVGLGVTAVGVGLDAIHAGAMLVAFIGVAALWWSYFAHAAPHSNAYFESLVGKPVGRYARDVYTMLHYPLVVGIVFFAVALEDVVAHPDEPLQLISRIAFGSGIALVLLSVMGVTYRAIRRIDAERVVASLLVVGLIWAGSALTSLGFAAVGIAILVTTLLLERLHPWPVPA